MLHRLSEARRRPVLPGIALAAVLLAAGCGGSGAGSSVMCVVPAPVDSPSPAATLVRRQVATKAKPTAAPKAAATPAPTRPAAGQKAQASPAPAAAPDGRALLAAARAAAASYQTYRMQIRSFDTSRDGRTTLSVRTTVTYQAPNRYRIDVEESSNPLAVGVTTLLQIGQSTVQVRPGGLLSLAKMTLPLTDGRVISSNGWRPDQLLLASVLDRFDESYSVEVSGRAKLNGQTVTMLTLRHPQDPLDPGIREQQIALDESNLAVLWRCYGRDTQVANDLLYERQILNFTPNPTLGADTFTF